MATEGYVLHCYGDMEYVRHAVASAVTLRRYDKHRPVALYASEEQIAFLERYNVASIFNPLRELPAEHRSIVGFKHHLHKFCPFDRNLFTDADIIWCRNSEPLWRQLQAYAFTSTGTHSADIFFGAAKDASIAIDILLNRRKKTLQKLGLSYLPRVQTGLMYVADTDMARSVCDRARQYLSRRDETHFQSRLEEGRSEETCEWSIAASMAYHQLPVLPWMQGYNSPQLDFIDTLTNYDLSFREVTCRYYCDPFVYSLRGIQTEWLQNSLVSFFRSIPGKGDYMEVTPYMLHFGWLHQKQPFRDFARRTWKSLIRRTSPAASLPSG